MEEFLRCDKLITATKLLLKSIDIDIEKYYWICEPEFKIVRYMCIWNLIKAFTDNDLLPLFTGNYSVNFNNGDIQFNSYGKKGVDEYLFNNFHKLTGYKIFYE